MDLDTTRRKYSYQKIIQDFEQRDIDILVGTQMVSKGLDFSDVTLVGIFDIDRMLHFPDFRATERAYQLTVQVSGRSGRTTKPGKVIVQTSNTKQPILDYISKQNFQEFYTYEIRERQKFKYPPYYRIIRITLRHREKALLQQAAATFIKIVKDHVHNDLVLGPHEPMIGRIRGLYLMEIIVKIQRTNKDLSKMKKSLAEDEIRLKREKQYRQVSVLFDVDPY